LAQKQVATDLNIPTSTYNQYETGKRKPDIRTLRKIAKYYGVSLDYLVGDSSNFHIIVKPPNFLNYDYGKYQDDLDNKRITVAQAVMDRENFQSDLMVEVFEKFISMNPQGQEKAIEYIRDLSEFPKYKKAEGEALGEEN